MSSIQPAKPILSGVIALLWLSCFVFIDAGPNGFLRTFYNMSDVEANSWKWVAIIVVGLIWLLVQIFYDAPGSASRLSLAISGTVMWLGLLLFYPFNAGGSQLTTSSYGGTVAFFAMLGGLLVVITWIRYLADEF
jgi:hypothetical protein